MKATLFSFAKRFKETKTSAIHLNASLKKNNKEETKDIAPVLPVDQLALNTSITYDVYIYISLVQS